MALNKSNIIGHVTLYFLKRWLSSYNGEDNILFGWLHRTIPTILPKCDQVRKLKDYNDASADARIRAGLLALAGESAIFAAVAAAAAQQLPPAEDTRPTNSTHPKFQISTPTSIGKYDSWKIDFSKPFRTLWLPVLGVSIGKCGDFFGERFLDCLCCCVACCSTAPGCPAWLQQQPAKALEVNRKILIAFNLYFLRNWNWYFSEKFSGQDENNICPGRHLPENLGDDCCCFKWWCMIHPRAVATKSPFKKREQRKCNDKTMI